MSIQSYEELLALKEVGRICGLALRAMAEQVRAGVTTAELAGIGAKVMRENGARSAPVLVYGFPGEVCISLNDEAVHGIPDRRQVRPGDLVKLDVTFEKNGYMADAAVTLPVEPVSDEARRLISCAERAFQQAMRVARAHHRVNEIGRAVEREVKRLLGNSRSRRARNRASHPRTSERAELQRSAGSAEVDFRACPHGRANYFHGQRGIGDRSRWLDGAHGGWQPFSALRAHDCDHGKRTYHSHGSLDPLAVWWNRQRTSELRKVDPAGGGA
ncbi:MAG: M24 family metallopeptidase [Candidatus Acidiferrales bacterium]